MPSSSDRRGAGSSAERWLASLDPIGWRFGLERIEALLRALGDPQNEFESVHVVGTNGKSSVTAMVAALLESGGLATGAYFSPHAERWAERVHVRGAEAEPMAFEAAVERVRDAVGPVEARLEAGERITQFEAATAAAFFTLADAGVDAAVIEAGLGGRLDATNVLRSRVTVLTSVGLDHTQFLGETEEEIAREKLAVLREGTILVTGELSPAVRAIAEQTAAERGCRFTAAPAPRAGARAPYLARNQAVATTAARAFLTSALPSAASLPGLDAQVTLDEEGKAKALAALKLPGRFEVIEGDPPMIVDAAHNPQGAAALAEALEASLGERPVVACLAVLADKDVEGIVRALSPALSEVVATEIPAERLRGSGRPGMESVSAVELARLFEGAGLPASAEGDPDRAIRLAFSSAREAGGVALFAGSHYLLGYAWTARRAQSSYR